LKRLVEFTILKYIKVYYRCNAITGIGNAKSFYRLNPKKFNRKFSNTSPNLKGFKPL
jgi:hypothetical protein